MASSNWQAPELTREQRVAATALRYAKLTPPVEVQLVVAHFADLEEDRIPGDCDGLILGLHRRGERRPLIIVEQTSSERRKRFTVAHELGHLLLPWHQGSTSACDVDSITGWDRHAWQARQAETEANRFAAALLLPPIWIDSIVAGAGSDDIATILQELQSARVSAQTLCIAASARLPPGHMFVVADRSGLVDLSGSSPDSSADLPRAGDSLEVGRLDRFAADRLTLRIGSRDIYWWVFPTREPDPVTDPRNSKEILDGLLARHCRDLPHAEKLRQSLAGIAGSAKSMSAHQGSASSAEIYAHLRRAFAKRRSDMPDAMLTDPDFELWVRLRALDIAAP